MRAVPLYEQYCFLPRLSMLQTPYMVHDEPSILSITEDEEETWSTKEEKKDLHSKAN